MMGHRQVKQAALFYEFSLERHVPADHLLRSIDRFVELGQLRRELAPLYSAIGLPSLDPELMIRMLIVGYCLGIRSEQSLCEEVHANLAYQWFCRLGLMTMYPIIRASLRTGMAASASDLFLLNWHVRCRLALMAPDTDCYFGCLEPGPSSGILSQGMAGKSCSNGARKRSGGTNG